MHKDNLSYWSDIKTFEEQLSRSPDSFCFARLSEIYLKVGLVYDALRTARQGVAIHPRYLAGLRALAMACEAKGLIVESLDALKLVTEAMPEDHQAQKLLGRLLVNTGDRDAARQAFRTALEFVPDDLECRTELESLEVSVGSTYFSQSVDDDPDLEIIEDLEILEEVEEDVEVEVKKEEELEPQPQPQPESLGDPLSTATLAELYVKQGFIDRALEIYRSILAVDPGNSSAKTRIADLEQTENISAVVKSPETPDSALSTMEGWLDNIEKLKSCR
jgi:tetratricopeptide (TPR) repeat protein